MSGTKKGGKKGRAIPPGVALAMLQSAVSYCRSAELPVKLSNVTSVVGIVYLNVMIDGVIAETGEDGITRFSLANQITSVAKEPAAALAGT